MTDFKAAFNQGIEAAEKTMEAKRQIEEVFANLNKDLSDVTDGKLAIFVRQYKKKIFSIFVNTDTKLDSDTENDNSFGFAIAARNLLLDGGPNKLLAEWSEDRRGFPCKVSWGSIDYICEDKSSLELSLQHLLRDPIIADILLSLMRLSDQQ